MDWKKRYKNWLNSFLEIGDMDNYWMNSLEYFIQSEITVAEQRGRNEVLEEIEKELPKEAPIDEDSEFQDFGRGANYVLSVVKSIIQRHKV